MTAHVSALRTVFAVDDLDDEGAGDINGDTITIRRAAPPDQEALSRLAGRDSAVLPDDDFLIADVAGEAWAAIGLRTGTVMADPFRPSSDVAELLRIRARDMAGHTASRRPPSPLRRRLARRVAA